MEELVINKAELLQLKPHPFICMRSFINKKVGNRKKLSTVFQLVQNLRHGNFSDY